MRIVPLCFFIAASAAYASDSYPPARFTDPDRARKLESVMPQVDRIFRDYMEAQKIAGMVWGVVIDGQLAHVGTAGLRDRGSNAPVMSGERVSDCELLPSNPVEPP